MAQHKRRAKLIVMPKPSVVPMSRLDTLEKYVRLCKAERKAAEVRLELERVLERMEATQAMDSSNP